MILLKCILISKVNEHYLKNNNYKHAQSKHKPVAQCSNSRRRHDFSHMRTDGETEFSGTGRSPWAEEHSFPESTIPATAFGPYTEVSTRSTCWRGCEMRANTTCWTLTGATVACVLALYLQHVARAVAGGDSGNVQRVPLFGSHATNSFCFSTRERTRVHFTARKGILVFPLSITSCYNSWCLCSGESS